MPLVSVLSSVEIFQRQVNPGGVPERWEMEDFEDKLENRKNVAKLNQEHKKEAKETFIQEYNEERSRYLKERKNIQ